MLEAMLLTKTLSFNKQNGFSLIEVMVSFLILGVGLLGMGTMVSNGVKMNQNAHFRTASVVLAQDLADKVRANRSVDYGDIENPTVDNSCILSASDTLTACTSLATTDLALWNQAVARVLPGGVGVICGDDTPMDGASPDEKKCDGGDATAIKIWWIDNSSMDMETEDKDIKWQRYTTVLY